MINRERNYYGPSYQQYNDSLVLTSIYFLELQRLLGQDLFNRSMENTTLLGVHEFFHSKDLEFPVLLTDGDDGRVIVIVLGIVDEGGYEGLLH
jgi:hypothetical protein